MTLISDQHSGLVEAASRHFQGASWQVHLMRNILGDSAPRIRLKSHKAPCGFTGRRHDEARRRLNEEIRRRERVIRVFPNDESALRLIGALLAEKNEVWQERVTSIWTTSRVGCHPQRCRRGQKCDQSCWLNNDHH